RRPEPGEGWQRQVDRKERCQGSQGEDQGESAPAERPECKRAPPGREGSGHRECESDDAEGEAASRDRVVEGRANRVAEDGTADRRPARDPRRSRTRAAAT